MFGEMDRRGKSIFTGFFARLVCHPSLFGFCTLTLTSTTAADDAALAGITLDNGIRPWPNYQT